MDGMVPLAIARLMVLGSHSRISAASLKVRATLFESCSNELVISSSLRTAAVRGAVKRAYLCQSQFVKYPFQAGYGIIAS